MKFHEDPNLQTKYEHHDHGRCYDLNEFPLAEDRLIDVRDFVSLFTVWDSE